MHILVDCRDGSARPDALLVLLPPAQARVVDFYGQGFVDAVRRRAIPADIWMAEVTPQHVMGKTVVSGLMEHVVQPATAAGYRDIWFVGISLGAYNALQLVARYPQHIAGAYLIAPYPGTGDVLAEIRAAGGPVPWAGAPLGEHDDERVWWHWLGQAAQRPERARQLYLATGTEDRFLRGQRMLADLLPPEHVHYLGGTHTWPTWQALWQHWLDHGPLASLAARSQEAT